ncbi:MAG: putative baseplate assembly protein [Actinomycetales bacterium]|nr:putative baseplate assembly protein [Actinomycetales bacterium]
MSLPAPHLDDRRFQDIVDEAKKLIPRYCPQWTDHNVSDPGVALIELFAWMTEMILYRVNQVPDRLYVKFLELVGIELFSASPARTDVVFELAAPPTEPLRIPTGTQVATDSDDDPVVFMTEEPLVCVSPTMTACLTRTADGVFADRWDDLRLATNRVPCFPSLRPGDALYLGFAESLAGNMVRLDVATSAEGAGIIPERPPRQWQAWDGHDWTPARILGDTSGGFNTPGEVTLLLPPRHEPLPVSSTRAHWLRCRLMPTTQGQPGYDVSPLLDTVVVTGLGGAVSAHHAEPAPTEYLGRSTGEPAQVFQVKRAPVLARRPDEHVRVVLPGGIASGRGAEETQDWSEVADFAETDETDRVYTWSGATGEIRFGPAVRQADGTVNRYGAVPPVDAQIMVTGYRFGGGRRGNVGAGTITSLRTSIPSVARVHNLDPATGGVDPETVDNARLRGPLELRGGQRAVTAADFERLTLAAAPGVARARCLAPQRPEDPVRLLVVPRVDVPPETLGLDDLGLSAELERTIADYLEARRLLTVRMVVDRPTYLGISIAARVRAAPGMRTETVRASAEAALYRYVNPVIGGPDGHGWPFGRDLNIGEAFALLSGVVGVLAVEEVVFFSGDLALSRGTRRTRDERLGNAVRLPEGSLFASCDHRVVVVQ